ncbi:hypothetical protein M0813_11733 [Anaeramoeba flamelloides]|uniref:Uncharacterized protein n=1 Tax=Anaeramoeba flamelloides TaxID=1746091 RepID=A0ABQ8ZEC4_9EUKA|nr:hypothetical protein M0813_11733 [Anaeramoeba flamelloides]
MIPPFLFDLESYNKPDLNTYIVPFFTDEDFDSMFQTINPKPILPPRKIDQTVDSFHRSKLAIKKRKTKTYTMRGLGEIKKTDLNNLNRTNFKKEEEDNTIKIENTGISNTDVCYNNNENDSIDIEREGGRGRGRGKEMYRERKGKGKGGRKGKKFRNIEDGIY